MWFKQKPLPPSPSFELGAAPLERLRRWFDREDVPIAPASAEQIARLEARYQVRLPDDFRAYLATIAPAVEQMDDECGTWWPVARIKNVQRSMRRVILR